jgi:hypothetical protein
MTSKQIILRAEYHAICDMLKIETDQDKIINLNARKLEIEKELGY